MEYSVEDAHREGVKMKKRSLAGNFALLFFAVGLLLVAVSFSTPSWLVSDSRITGAKLNKLGLWTHCFRSLPDPNSPHERRFFVGCRWIYDPFTTGYDRIRGFLVPGFMIATQFFYTLCFISVLISTILCLLYFLCCSPDQERFIQLVKILALVLLVGSICGIIAVVVFASLANRSGWMPGHDNNFFGWSFILACVGVVCLLVSSILFFTDASVYQRKERYFKESQSRFNLQEESKA